MASGDCVAFSSCGSGEKTSGSGETGRVADGLRARRSHQHEVRARRSHEHGGATDLDHKYELEI